ncbi:unnamed protein product, partial [marine sediment metagenome]
EALENERSEMRDKLEEQERRLKKLEDPVEELTSFRVKHLLLT